MQESVLERAEVMSILPRSIQNLIEEFSKLPGIGPKTAGRLVFYLLSKPDQDLTTFSDALRNLKKDLTLCDGCFNYTQKKPCNICSDPKRDKTKIMVVEEPLDVIALDRTNYDGLFHVLGGAISPIEGIGPEQLRINQLLDKLKKDPSNDEAGKIKEIILATDPSLEGEATAMYIQKKVSQEYPKVLITRIARGLPVGGDLEYADEITLTRALEGRSKY